MKALSRAFTSDLEVRADGDGRTIQGIVVPYGQTARVSDGGPAYEERFQRGAFAQYLHRNPIDKKAVRLLSQHDSNKPLGRAIEMAETEDGLYGAFRVSDTAYGRDQLELVRDGVLGAFSVGFVPMQAKRVGKTTVRTEVALREVSLVTFPAYEGAIVTGVRALAPDEQMLAQQLLTVLAVADARLDPIVDALCQADGALDAAQMVISQILGVPNPDCDDEEEYAEDDMQDPADPTADPATMQMSSSLTSLARRLDEAIAARNAPTTVAGADGPLTPPNRLLIARNVLRANLIERGIRP
jgi:HK97 family phage prohead protease